MTPLVSNFAGEKNGVESTCTLYDTARDEGFHIKVGVVETLLAVCIGHTSVGAGGASTIVEKLHAADHPLVPPAFVAFTRQ